MDGNRNRRMMESRLPSPSMGLLSSEVNGNRTKKRFNSTNNGTGFHTPLVGGNGGSSSLLSEQRNQLWQGNIDDLSPDSKELFDDLEDAEREQEECKFRKPSRMTPGINPKLNFDTPSVLGGATPFTTNSTGLADPYQTPASVNFGNNNQNEEEEDDSGTWASIRGNLGGAGRGQRLSFSTPMSADSSILSVSKTHMRISSSMAEGDDEDNNEEEHGIIIPQTVEQHQQQEEQSAQDLMDESERLARQLMEEEEALFLQRLHEEQMRALAEMQGMIEIESSNDVASSSEREGGDSNEQQEGGGEEDRDRAAALRLLREEEEQFEQEASLDPESMSYDELLELSERMGDVKQERWRVDGRRFVESLEIMTFDTAASAEKFPDLDLSQCVVCQYSYEQDDELKVLPCKHVFHAECIDPWLETHDTCVTCKQSLKDLMQLSPKQ